jgi:hypothetical protein
VSAGPTILGPGGHPARPVQLPPRQLRDAARVRSGLHGNSETLLEYSPDYAAERASGVVSDCAKLGIELPAVELLDLMPEWSVLLH